LNKQIKKKDGFHGQKMIVIPRGIIMKRCVNNPVIKSLFITDIGYYPKAQFHFMKRAHGAEQCILIYCNEGAGKVTIEKTEYKISAGEYLTIEPKKAHSYVADEENPWSIYWIHFTGTTSEALISDFKEKNGVKGFINNSQKCIKIFNEIYTQLERGYSIQDLLFVNMTLWYFFTTFFFNEKYNETNNSTIKDAIDLSIDYLNQNINQVLTLNDIAKEANISPSHFSYLFKKRIGFSPIEFFNHLKIQKACQYLLFTKLRVKEISLELGIEDQHYFSRIFVKVMGFSPKEYRKRRQNELLS
jgi:AraC-like DNA-binding protein